MIPGQRVRLRRIERADLPRFVEWLNDPELRDHLAAIYPLSQAQEEQWFESMLRQEPTQQPFAIDARLQAQDQGCGRSWAPSASTASTGATARPSWACSSDRGSCGARASAPTRLRALVAFAFRELNLHRVWLRVYEENTRARRSYEKVGFVVEGRLRQDRFHGGRYTDTLVMGLLREEWQPEGASARRGSARSSKSASPET